MSNNSIRPKLRNAVLDSLRAGVTPGVGIHHIQVGREREVQSLVEDISGITKGHAAAYRFVIGDYGSGKSFFLKLISAIAREKGLVTVSADLSPNRRLNSSKGQARALYAELMKNMATRAKPGGNAMSSVVEKFITQAKSKAKTNGDSVNVTIKNELAEFSGLVAGYDFANVIACYWQGHKEEDEVLKGSAIRWLRGEFTSKLDARAALGVRNIIDDDTFYDYLKLMALFVKKAGYKGMLVNLDEMVNLYKISHTQSRTLNYEQILRMLNDCLQGGARYIGFLLGGTPEFLEDKNKGLYSYEALKSRLVPNQFANKMGVTDYNATVLHLPSLSPEELYLLLENVRHVHACGNPEDYIVTDEAIHAYLNHCSSKIGQAFFKTPRNTIRGFVDLISVLEQHPDIQWQQLVEKSEIEIETDTDMPEVDVIPAPGMPSYGDQNNDQNNSSDLGNFKLN
ncbi:ATP-binding protein [Chromatiales bacterium (ex Bugula neritina AB1)]|nr:ATP-binding protein [Chromatiales bacterium (ex Bugula neritina AB1)]